MTTLDGPTRPQLAPAPRVRRERHGVVFFIALAVCAMVLLPVVTLAGIALSGTGEAWPHLASTVLPRATLTTLHLLALVAVLTAVTGVACAWLVVAYEFPLRKTLAWALVLPLAVPPYLAAYAFAEFFLFTGPVQTLWRSLFGFQSARDYWFPDLRSTGGAALVMSCVLYPYVYLTARVVFIMQGRNIADVARTLGAKPSTVFRRILLPVSRPAIVAGVALVLMETLNDFGASEYLGVRTLTLSVFTTWLNRGSLEGAAQIAMLMLVLVFALLMAEQWARRRQRFHSARATHMKARPPRVQLKGWKGPAATLAVATPMLLGFGIPIYVFGTYALRRTHQFFDPALARAFVNSLTTALAAAVLAVVIALLLINAARVARSRTVTLATRFAMIGYALPGTIMALGLLFSLARFDNWLDAQMREWFDVSTGLLLTGSATAIVLACSIRFLALAEGAIRSGLEKLPPNIDEAARSLGRSSLQSAASVTIPLLWPAIFTAGVLVFVDTIKELSATILLRPFGFNTLATFIYENASRGMAQDGAVAALLVIVTALVPVVLLSGALMRDRDAMM
ncbi:ABC transporter permease [Neoaquamicrobium microcysteis]|nr:iron ABC transporter permease [Mesorhizobium microcysteis]